MENGLAAFFAPMTLLLGGVLVALGALSFLDLNFFKTQLRAKVALAAGLAFLLATEAMFLTSTGAGRYFSGLRLDVTDCEYRVEEAFPLERGKPGRVISDNIKACMDELGYDWSTDPSALPGGRGRHQHLLLFAASAACPRDRRVSDEVRITAARFEAPAIARGAALP
jgi:hypothetical protein